MSNQEPALIFAKTIRQARKRRGWSQWTLAKQAGLSRPTVARIETGKFVNTSSLTKIAKALDLSVSMEQLGNN
ncbi:helix-turn-helix domain-containing protein [Actinomyces minihominis]|uniref:helix-turn-helix domain-containing protein n=1 Tax=Actinomyces minihominis TaxID=2002838 RepID=UPI000C07111F|nr:helix-turn-helix transcriptional regulator [Actinomyces minihominis]